VWCTPSAALWICGHLSPARGGTQQSCAESGEKKKSSQFPNVGEQPRQPCRVASCNLANGIEGDGFHLVERDARRLIQAGEVGD
jgi:hypothetical protein